MKRPVCRHCGSAKPQSLPPVQTKRASTRSHSGEMPMRRAVPLLRGVWATRNADAAAAAAKASALER
eukprot:12139713-Karenia_brevis.AAC.1